MPLHLVRFEVASSDLPLISATLTASAEQAVRQASFEVAHIGPGIPCRPDMEAKIHVDDELWGTGYIRDVNPSHDEETRQFQVSFVSKTVDATEASIDHPTGFKKDCTLKEVAEEFDTYGIGVEGDGGSEKKARHKVIPGETLFETLEPSARADGVLIYDTPEGKLKLAQKPEGRHAGALKRGANIRQASAKLTGRNNYSAMKIRGQASEGVSPAALRAEAETKGTGKRRRILIKTHEGEATSGRMKKRAKWEAKRAAGKGAECQIIVAGFRAPDGKIWQPNFLVEVDDDWIGIQQDMVTGTISFAFGEQGCVSTLSLKDPRAFGGDNPRGKSDAAWAAPSADASFRDE